MINITDKEELELLRKTMVSLTQASGGASQLIHHLQHPGFMPIRLAIDLTNDAIKKMVDFQATRTVFINK